MLMTKRVTCASIIVSLLILAGCKQDIDKTTLSPYLYDYAPVNTGHYVVYDVDSIRYNFVLPDSQYVDTIHYQIKELVQDTFYDNLGNLSYRLEISKRYDTMQPLNVVDRAWYSYTSKNTYEKNEDDLRFIKLVFPPINGVTWKGNSYLPASDTNSDVYKTYAGWTYTYSAVNLPKAVNGNAFDSTLVVTEVDNQNLIDKKLSRETYARHVGLIYKEWEIINKQDVASSWAAPNMAVGFRIRMKIHTYHQ
jgi:hypothetical protein